MDLSGHTDLFLMGALAKQKLPQSSGQNVDHIQNVTYKLQPWLLYPQSSYLYNGGNQDIYFPTVSAQSSVALSDH
jgi:hypothetical protein